jgi:polar amino acid transport system substrate-binding protein
MKKFFAIALAALLLLSCLTACGASGKSLADVKKAGKLTVATSPDFPPFEFLGENGEVTGIEMDILALVCAELGVELEINQMDFDSVLPGIQAGKYDMGVSGISVTPEREKNVLFTDPYCLAAQAIVVLKDSPIQTKADLTGKKIAVQTGTTAESYCMENSYDISAFAANNDAQSALLTGKVDAWVIDDLTAADMVKAYNEANGEQLVILSEALTTEPYAFAFAFGSETLVEEINKIIADLLADGTIAAIFEKYEAPYTAPTN